MSINGKTVSKAVAKTLVVLAVILLILFLDVAVIRGVYYGIKWIGDTMTGVVQELYTPETEEEETEETERRLNTEEILRQENEKLDKIFATALETVLPLMLIKKIPLFDNMISINYTIFWGIFQLFLVFE